MASNFLKTLKYRCARQYEGYYDEAYDVSPVSWILGDPIPPVAAVMMSWLRLPARGEYLKKKPASMFVLSLRYVPFERDYRANKDHAH